jgi:hypothetical protein
MHSEEGKKWKTSWAEQGHTQNFLYVFLEISPMKILVLEDTKICCFYKPWFWQFGTTSLSNVCVVTFQDRLSCG